MCRKQDLEHWVYCYFDRVGKLIVLDSGEGPQLADCKVRLVRGKMSHKYIRGTLGKDGTIVDLIGALIGNVTITGRSSGRMASHLPIQFGGSSSRYRLKD